MSEVLYLPIVISSVLTMSALIPVARMLSGAEASLYARKVDPSLNVTASLEC